MSGGKFLGLTLMSTLAILVVVGIVGNVGPLNRALLTPRVLK
jgi:hypothetical protein